MTYSLVLAYLNQYDHIMSLILITYAKTISKQGHILRFHDMNFLGETTQLTTNG